MAKLTEKATELFLGAHHAAESANPTDPRGAAVSIAYAAEAICHELGALRETMGQIKEPTPWVTKKIANLTPEQKDAIAGLIEEMVPGVEHNLTARQKEQP